MTYAETIQFLYGLRLFGLKLGLENTRQLAARAGHPERDLRFIHVAGTNGKGSTCAMLEAVYRASGRRVGLFTSPHLVSFRERIQVDRRLISEAEVVDGVATLRPWLADVPADHHPTFFEVVTVLALRYFAAAHCDLVIWETGLGGRLDATNIVTPLATVITNIQLDHQKWLGNTRAEIAAEKAGIIKPHVPVLTGADAPDALEVIERIALDRKAPLTRVPREHADRLLPQNLTLALAGEHQRLNAALAVATVQLLQPVLPVSDDAVRRGLGSVAWAGRMQLVRASDGRSVLLDGAHNEAGAEALSQAFRERYPGVRPTIILGILDDKDWVHMCQHLAPLAARIRVVPVKSDRSAEPESIREACLGVNPGAPVELEDSLVAALRASARDPFILVTGSLYLVGEALSLLGQKPVAGIDEQGLNEWGIRQHG